jgi:hypothetical protein
MYIFCLEITLDPEMRNAILVHICITAFTLGFFFIFYFGSVLIVQGLC